MNAAITTISSHPTTAAWVMLTLFLIVFVSAASVFLLASILHEEDNDRASAGEYIKRNKY